MGKIDNINLTLESFLKQNLLNYKELKILTGNISEYGIKILLDIKVNQIFIITGNIDPRLLEIINLTFQRKEGYLFQAVDSGRLRMWFHPKVHLKVFILIKESPYAVIIGSSNLTYQGLKGRGEQNNFSRRKREVFKEIEMFEYYLKDALLINLQNLPNINREIKEKLSKFESKKIDETIEYSTSVTSEFNPRYTFESFIFDPAIFQRV